MIMEFEKMYEEVLKVSFCILCHIGLVIIEKIMKTVIVQKNTRCVPKDMKYIFLPLSYWSQPVLTGWLRWGGPLSS